MILYVCIIIIILFVIYFYLVNNNFNNHGEDEYYKIKLNINKNFSPIQIGFFKVNCNSNDEFKKFIEVMIPRVNMFIKKKWKDYDNNIVCEIKNLNELLKLDCTKIKVMRLFYNINTYSVYIILNHGTVGGGDYLELGKVIFMGESNSLIKYENNTIINTYLKFKFFYNVFKKLYFKQPLNRYQFDRVIYSKIDLNNSQNKLIKTKYLLIHNILSNIINSCKNRTNLVCWLPIAFEKYINSPNNNIGIIVFTFKKNMTQLELQNEIENNKDLCIGCHKCIIDSYNISSTISHNIESKIKKNIDVCITLANIFNNKYEPDIFSFGMYYKMNMSDPPFPYYIGGFTINNTAHITYSVTDIDCNINKLKELSNGIEFTNKHIYKLNK